tara:strand:+ start:209 stop:1015 length:807 start_codon:yes stop_codon:yes gene_type:complete
LLKLNFIKINFLDNISFYFKFFIFTFLTIFLVFFKIFVQFISKRTSEKIVQIFHKLLLWLININIEVTGERNINDMPTLYISNHLSYLDIPVLGSTLNGRFVAKIEISKWPLIGYLSKVGNTIFINRNLRFLKNNKSMILDYISKGDNIILFPEGTTSDGIRVLKFKSSLLTSLEQKNILIQPIVISYKSINGMPLNRWLKPIIAWYGDMDLKPHIINILKLFSIKVKVTFLPPFNGRDFRNRKDMTSNLHHAIDNFYSHELNNSASN